MTEPEQDLLIKSLEEALKKRRAGTRKSLALVLEVLFRILDVDAGVRNRLHLITQRAYYCLETYPLDYFFSRKQTVYITLHVRMNACWNHFLNFF